MKGNVAGRLLHFIQLPSGSRSKRTAEPSSQCRCGFGDRLRLAHKTRVLVNVAAVLSFILVGSHFSSDTHSDQGLPLTETGRHTCTIVTISRNEPDLLIRRAMEAITVVVRRWGGADLPVVNLKEHTRSLPAGPAIVLTTLDGLRSVAPEIEQSTTALMRLAFMDEQGFVCVPVESKGVTQMFVVSRTSRGVFNGAVYLRDFLIEGAKDLYVQRETVIRSPQMGGRPVYLLTIWGNEDEYTVQDWKLIFDSFARDGMDRIYFWLSGHFPSKKFPKTHKVANTVKGITYDSTKDSGIPTLEDQRQLIRSAHEMGLKFYLGGALGGWVGTVFITDLEKDTLKKGVGDSSLCPSNSKVRQALVQYYREMLDALPEADGLYLESADEDGDCQCPVCSRPIDSLGSKQFGQAQLSLLQEIMHEIWRDHPHARLAYTVGYSAHKSDAAYYEAIRQMNDPRLEWMEARASWEFPATDGKALPAAYISRHMMGWRYHDTKPMDELVSDISRMGKEGWYGCISTFSPGFSSGSFHKDIPFPTDQLPYILTHFAHREMTWEPALTIEELRKRVHRRFFGKEAAIN